MNKLISNINGGYPFVLDDLRFMDESYREAFKGSFRHLEIINGRDGIIFNTDDTIPLGGTLPETFVFYNGEIYRIPSQTLSSSGGWGVAYVVSFPTSYQTGGAGTKTFQDGNTHETYQIREATITKVSVPQQNDFVFSYWSFVGWTFSANHTYRDIMRRMLGVVDIELDVTSLNTDVQTNQTAIQNNGQQISYITDPWLSIPSTGLINSVRQTSNTDGTGTLASLDTFTAGGSWFKYKIIGKTVHVNFKLVGMQLQQFDDYPAGAIVVKNLPSLMGMNGSTIADFSTLVRGECTAVSSGSKWELESGTVEARTSPNNLDLVFRMIGQRYSTAGYWNRKYNLTTSSNSRTVSATNDNTFLATYMVYGTFTIELL